MLVQKIKNVALVLWMLVLMGVVSGQVMAVGPKKSKEFDLTIINNTNLDIEFESLSEKYHPEPIPVIKSNTKETFPMPVGSIKPHGYISLVDPIKDVSGKMWMQKHEGGGHQSNIALKQWKGVVLMEYTEENIKADDPKPGVSYGLNAEFKQDGDNYIVIISGGPR